jgi:hypothetical protein
MEETDGWTCLKRDRQNRKKDEILALLRASMFTIDGFMQSKRKRFSQKISHN